jgi:outer membrane translocation and assembly module TamA
MDEYHEEAGTSMRISRKLFSGGGGSWCDVGHPGGSENEFEAMGYHLGEILPMNPKQLVCAIYVAAVFSLLAVCPDPGLSQAVKSSSEYPAHLPYSFSNIVWWSDDELRSLLKTRIPGLGDEIATTSVAEGRMREALKVLLQEKGIRAEVQSEEPSNSSLQHPPMNMLGVDDQDIPTFIHTISFSVLTPRVIYGRITVTSDAQDLTPAIEAEFKDTEGRQFTTGSIDFAKTRLGKISEQYGYLASKVTIQRDPPRKLGSDWATDIKVEVDAGPRFHVSAISVDGGPLFDGKDLTQLVNIRKGDEACRSPFERLGPELRSYYAQQGFADVKIRQEPKIDREHATVEYTLKVIPGPIYHLRSLKIEKLSTEQEKRVRDLLGMKPGDIYHEDAITNLYRKVSGEPSLKGYGFGFSPKPDKSAGMVDLSLSFFREGGSTTVTTQ